MSEEWKAQYNKAGRLWFWGVDVQENPGGTPEARSYLCVLSGFLPHDLCHGWDSSHWLPAMQVLKFTILTILSIQPSGTKYIHIVVQPSPPSISTTLSSPQHSAHFTPGQVPPKTNDPCLVDMESQLLVSRAQSSSHVSLSHTGLCWSLFTLLFLRFTWHFNHQFLRIWWQRL